MTVENNIITDPFMRNFIIKLHPVKNKQAGRDTFERYIYTFKTCCAI